MADRYTYIPHIGLFIALVWGAIALAKRLSPTLATSRLGLTVLAIAVAALSLRTRDQITHWRDSGTLFSHALRVTDRNTVALVNYALVLAQRGEIDASLDHYHRAIDIAPRDPFIWFNAGRVLANAGRHEQSLRYAREAIRLAPDHFAAHYELAVDLAQNGKVREALPEFEIALRLQPESPQVHYAYGLALRDAGERVRAMESFRRAAELARNRRNDALFRQIEAQLAGGAATTAATTRAAGDAGHEMPASPLSIPATNPDNRPRR